MKHIIRSIALALCMMLLASNAFALLPSNYVIYHGDRSVNKIAITVDDGFNYDMIRAIHELSVELDFPITWFMVGYYFFDEEKALWEDIIAHGSEIGNHTWKHSRLLSFSVDNVRPQIQLTQERLDEMLGYHYPLRIFRPPYGGYSDGEKNYLEAFYEQGVEKVIMWDVDTTDPNQAFWETKNGSILIYHTNQADYECLKVLIPRLKDAGYELVTISELLGLEPLEIGGEPYDYVFSIGQ